MTPILVIGCICIIAYIVILYYIIKGNKKLSTDNKNIIKILAPTQSEIKKDKERLSQFRSEINNPLPSDKIFEEICRYILKEDPNPRKVVKFIHESFVQESDKEMLLLCLSINNPILYNEVISLLNCDTSKFETFDSKKIEIQEDELPENDIKIHEAYLQTGIPADFFFTALELSTSSEESVDDLLNNINNIFDSLNPAEQELITRQSKNIRKRNKKRPGKLKSVDITRSIKEGEQIGEDFMELWSKLERGEDIE